MNFRQLPLSCLFISLACCTASVSIIIVGPEWPEPSLSVTAPPGFVVAEYGVRHDLRPVYSEPLALIGDEPVVYNYSVEVLSGPDGLTIQDGVLEWVPSADQIGSSVSVSYAVAAYHEGTLLLDNIYFHSFSVLATLPTIEPQANASFGQHGNARNSISYLRLNPHLSDEEKSFLQWSLLRPQVGVTITADGDMRWPSTEVYGGFTEFPVGVRIDYETPNGTLSQETCFTQVLLPPSPTQSWSDTWKAYGTAPGSNLGYSLASDGALFIAGEPHRSDDRPDAPAGQALIARYDATTGVVVDRVTLMPLSGGAGEAFGASVGVSAERGDTPAIAVVGAPEATFSDGGVLANCGRIEIFEQTEAAQWLAVAAISPQSPAQDLFFGGWVDVDGDTIVASIEGADSQGPFTGAVEVHLRDAASEVWQYAQTLTAPDAGSFDYFGWPVAIDGDWIAAAANEDDDNGLNAGAVHLFQRTVSGFTHRQKLLGHQAGSLFGERIHLVDDWLFVSAFRETLENESVYEGAVYVYKLTDDTWAFHQRLTGPFTDVASTFGFALDTFGDTLAISAPAVRLFHDVEYPWDGLTLYRLADGQWQWHQHCPYEDQRYHAWGYALAQVGPDTTIVGAPFRDLNEGRDLAGIIQKIDWQPPTPLSELFEAELAELDAGGGDPDGDEDGNGIANSLQWAMGENIEQAPHIWRDHPEVSQPRIREVTDQGVRFFTLPLERGVFLSQKILISPDCQSWSECTDARWQALEYNELRGIDGSIWGTYIQPVLIPWANRNEPVFVRFGVGSNPVTTTSE